jgi:DNA polymerase III subunit gamma/tau
LTKRMAAICAQEGIEADADALAVLAQAGEGSVRDSLSALDQAIACCGAKLNAADVRALLGAFSLESLDQVSQALLDGNAARMLEVVDELERNGRNLQHFCRELSRYFRNLLVMRIAAGGANRLVAASESQRQKLAETAARFSEEDLTRYLQLSLDLFRGCCQLKKPSPNSDRLRAAHVPRRLRRPPSPNPRSPVPSPQTRLLAIACMRG